MNSLVQYVALTSNKQREGIENGNENPTLIESESGSSNSFVLDSKDRTTGNISEFICNMGYQLMKARYCQVKRVVIPKINNVNVRNRTIRMRSGATTTNYFYLPVGLYNTSSLSNALVSAINAEFAISGIVDSVTCSFDPITRTMELKSVGGIDLAFDEDCDFIVYGKNLVPFESQSMAVAPSKTTLYSATCGMIYTRYLTISSDSLTQYSVGNSLLSSDSQPPSIIAVVDLVDLYTENDFDLTKVFNGVYRSIDVNSAPRLRVLNNTRTMPSNIDVSIRDEYGRNLNDIIQLGFPYPTDNSGIVILLEVFL